jgi:hypothetical protein
VQATADYQSLVRERDSRDSQLAAAMDARGQLEASKAAGIETVEEAIAKSDAMMKRYQDACRHVRDLEQQLAFARAEEVALGRDAAETVKNISNVENHAVAMAAWESQVAAAEALKPIDPMTIGDAKQGVIDAREAIERGALARKAKEQLEAAKDFAEAAKQTEIKAAKLRDNATKTDAILAAELQRIGCPWYPVDVPAGSGTARRLKVKHPRRGETLVSELSEGERARDAIDVALALSGKSDRPAVLILRQEQFEGLQPKVRAEIDQHAKDRGVVILTAAASDDEEVTL